MLWQVNNSSLHILGSVHVSDRPLRISEQTVWVLNDAAVLAFETNLDLVSKIASERYQPNDSLSRHIPTALFDDTRRLWTDLGLAAEELERLLPWQVAFRLMNAVMASQGFVGEHGIDRRIFSLGKKSGKTLFFLESVDAGIASFADAPAQEHEIFLSRVVQHTQEGLQDVASLISTWESGVVTNLNSIVERALSLMPVSYSAALAGRNRAWLRNLLRLARSKKNVVVIVGMLHMVGPNSIPSLMAAAGHTCTERL